MYAGLNLNLDVLNILLIAVSSLTIAQLIALSILYNRGPVSFSKYRTTVEKTYKTLLSLTILGVLLFAVFNGYSTYEPQEIMYSEKERFEELEVAIPTPAEIGIRARMRELRLLKETNDRIKKEQEQSKRDYEEALTKQGETL